MNKSEVTIVIPAFNEEKGIEDVIKNVKQLKDYNLLVVDDGSTDNTFEIVKNSSVEVVRHKYNKGYGAALKTGLRNAKTSVTTQPIPPYNISLIRYIWHYISNKLMRNALSPPTHNEIRHTYQQGLEPTIDLFDGI